MKVIKKENLEFVNGYLVDKEGNVYNDSRVVESAETFAKTVELLDFIREADGTAPHRPSQHDTTAE